uniref:Uncharacterized protein n=1 Tax=Salix viminalis TaxID=40686 RepID=A0A6N2L459_SALVM
MDSGYFGDPNFGNNERSGGSSRKGKKSSSDKPKQPQRGLGVAQLEKIRLHGQMGCNYHPSLHSTPPYPTAFNPQEDIRVQTGYSSAPSSSFSYSSSAAAAAATSASYGYMELVHILNGKSIACVRANPHFNYTTMGIGDYDGTNIGYGDSQPSTAASWNSGHGIYEAPHYAQPNNSTRHLLPLQAEDAPPKKSKKHRSSSKGSSSQNSEASDTQELDLELRLSL